MGEIMKSKIHPVFQLCVLLVLVFFPNLAFSANLNHTQKSMDSVLSDPVLRLDSAKALGPNPFEKQTHGYLLKMGTVNSQTAYFPETLNSKHPIVLKTFNDTVEQSLVSDEVYHAELKGRYLIYRGKHNSILYRYDVESQSLREFVYLENKTQLQKDRPVIEWKFAGANLKSQKDGSVILIKARDIKNEVRKISNDSMANRIQRFLEKKNTSTKNDSLIQTLFIIPKPEFIDGNQEHHTQGLNYSVHNDQLALNLEPNEQLKFPLWVDPTVVLNSNDNFDVLINGQDAYDNFGGVVVGDIDINGDGLDDVIIGASEDDNNGDRSGRVFIFFGRLNWPTPLTADTNADVIINGNSVNGILGRTISAGDMNNDGIDDVILGQNDNPGRVFVFFGRNVWASSLDIETDANVIINGTGFADGFGNNLSVLGDINGDEVDDLIIGALFDDNSGNDSGSAFVFFGRSSWSSPLNADNDADVIINGTNAGGLFSGGLGRGDFNGDGLGDFIVRANGGEFIFFGRNSWSSPLNADSDADVIIDVRGSISQLGGDINNDGFDDLIVYANREVLIFFGRNVWPSSLNSENANIILDGVLITAILNDINEDGIDDLIVGEPSADVSFPQVGKVYVLYGRDTWPSSFELDEFADIVINGVKAEGGFGGAVTPTGDVNGDGFEDLLIGARMHDIRGQESGSAYIFFGPFKPNNLSFSDAQDSYIRQTSPSTNFGNEAVLLADGVDQDPSNGLFGEVRSVISWDVSDIPPNATIESATIDLFHTNTSTGSYGIYEAKVPWSEESVTWNNFDDPNNTGTELLGFVNSSGPTSFNQAGLDLIQGWIDGSIPNNGIIIKSIDTNDGIDINSSEAADNQPVLNVKFSNDPPPSLQVTDNFQDAKDAYVYSFTPDQNYGDDVKLISSGNELASEDPLKHPTPIYSLISWDISSIPQDAVIQSVKISFNVTNDSEQDFEIYEMINRWEEDVVTWGNFSFGPRGSVGRELFGSFSPGTLGEHIVELNDKGEEIVREWIRGTVANNGLIIRMERGGELLDQRDRVEMNSSEAATGNPKIEVTYLTSPPPGETTVDLVNAEDSYVRETSPTVNYGSEPVLLADGSDEDPDNSNLGELLSVISWDVSGIANTSVVQNAQVTLDLFNPSSGEYKLYAVNTPWAEGTVSWNDVGSDIGSTVLGTIAAGSLGSTVINLNASGLALVQGWVDGTIPNNGFAVRTGGATNGIDFNSSEAGSGQPKLTITYSDSGPPPPTPVEVNIGNAEDSYLRETSGNTNYGSETLLQADGVDQDPGNGNYGELRPVLSWDVSSIPTDAVVDSASINLSLTDSSTGSYELFSVNSAWTEGTVVWNDLDGPGDTGSTVIGTITSGIIGNTVINLNASGVALVQGWIDGSISNNGIIIKSGGTNNGIDISSSEASSGQPILNVTYTQP